MRSFPWALFYIGVLAVTPLVSMSTRSGAHNGYPQSCCTDKDCAPATKVVHHSDGSITATTKHGTARFYPRHNPNHRRMSHDRRYHACLRAFPKIDLLEPLAICLMMPGVI